MPVGADVVVEVRDGELRRVGQVDVGVVGGGKFVKRKDAVGAWTFTLPDEHPLTAALKAPRSGVVVWLHGAVFLSGPTTSWVTTRSASDPQGTATFVGADDVVVLADHACYPDPGTADFGAQAAAYDVRSGPVETVVKGYVAANVGPAAPAARRGLLGSRLTVEPDRRRGQVVSTQARFDVLGEKCAALTAVDGSLGFDVAQIDGGTATVFTVYDVTDRTATVRMDVDNDLLTSTESGVAAPTVTRALVAGQGTGTDRQLYEVTDDLAVEAEAAWGRRVELFVDQRQSDDPDQLVQGGLKRIVDGGRTVVSLKVVPADQSTMRYGLDWGVGDRVAVVVDGQPLADVVSEAILAVDEGDVRVGATVGDPVGYDWEAAVTAAIVDQGRRLSLLERAP